jgi:hypothetical protein
MNKHKAILEAINDSVGKKLKMSFYNGTLKKDELKEFILNTEKPIRYTHGLKFRGPATYNVPISKEKALNIIEKNNALDAKELDDVIDLNTYTDSDLW